MLNVYTHYIFIFRSKDAPERFIYVNTMWSYDQVFHEILLMFYEILSIFYKTLFHGIKFLLIRSMFYWSDQCFIDPIMFYWSDQCFIDPINVLLIRSMFYYVILTKFRYFYLNRFMWIKLVNGQVHHFQNLKVRWFFLQF